VTVQVDQAAADSALAPLEDALDRGRRVHLTYYVPGRDEATERDVDPMRLLVVEGRTYLEGYCRRAEDVRLFRLDRVLGTEVLPVAAEIPRDAQPVDVGRGLYRPSPDDLRVVLELSAAGRWVAEYYPCEEVTEMGDGRLRVALRTPDRQWVRRLALGLGEDGRITEPEGLAAEVRAAAAAALGQYAQVAD
jgi:proteasome accessory factor C